MYLPALDSDKHCPDEHPCGPVPAPAVVHDIPVLVTLENHTVPLGGRNSLGIALIVILTVLGLVLYVSFAKWPRKKMSGWTEKFRTRPWRTFNDETQVQEERRSPGTVGANHGAYTSSTLLATAAPELPQANEASQKEKRGKHRATESFCSIDLSN